MSATSRQITGLLRPESSIQCAANAATGVQAAAARSHLQNSDAVRVGGIRRVCSLAAREGEAELAARRRQPIALIGARLQHHLLGQ